MATKVTRPSAATPRASTSTYMSFSAISSSSPAKRFAPSSPLPTFSLTRRWRRRTMQSLALATRHSGNISERMAFGTAAGRAAQGATPRGPALVPPPRMSRPTSARRAILWMSATLHPGVQPVSHDLPQPTRSRFGRGGGSGPLGPHSVIGAFQPTNVSPFYGPAIVGSSVGTDGGRKKSIMLSGVPTATAASGGLYIIWQCRRRF